MNCSLQKNELQRKTGGNKTFKNKSSSGHVGVSNMIVKISATVLAPFLANVFNECFKEGIFPNSLKIAKVIALHKTGDKTDPNNYRPISLLPVIKFMKELFTIE